MNKVKSVGEQDRYDPAVVSKTSELISQCGFGIMIQLGSVPGH